MFTGCSPEYFLNPSGSFTVGGPPSDTGLTGRKIIVDTYGGSCPHGGRAFSGKDPARLTAQELMQRDMLQAYSKASKLADRCTIQLSYAIGVADPTSSL
ncbi:MAG: methionine adenosyltransferase domain-containing protein [Ignavibacteria bacterium]|nr:methionine adenosyltransferase domain-containing protein [Ignavibacteria bacterium]